jgi:hypothetical protein
MNCLSEETLRAYHDCELPDEGRAEIESHVTSCARCREQLGRISETAGRVQGRLHALDASDPEAPEDPKIALARFRAQLGEDEERTPILASLFAGRWRLAWAAGAVAAILLVSLAFPSGRSLAQRLLTTLRVEKVQPIRLDIRALNENRTLVHMLDQLISDKVAVVTDEKSQKVATLAEASQLGGFAVRVPRDMTVTPQFNVAGRNSSREAAGHSRPVRARGSSATGNDRWGNGLCSSAAPSAGAVRRVPEPSCRGRRPGGQPSANV